VDRLTRIGTRIETKMGGTRIGTKIGTKMGETRIGETRMGRL
jgi:hypothetical protein